MVWTWLYSPSASIFMGTTTASVVAQLHLPSSALLPGVLYRNAFGQVEAEHPIPTEKAQITNQPPFDNLGAADFLFSKRDSSSDDV